MAQTEEQKTESFLWGLIEKANWKKDHDYRRIEKEFKNLPKDIYKELQKFAYDKVDELHVRFGKQWLGDPGIECSDDSWSDLRAEVVGRGEKFFNKITVKKLQKMALTRDYRENFTYSLQD